MTILTDTIRALWSEGRTPADMDAMERRRFAADFFEERPDWLDDYLNSAEIPALRQFAADLLAGDADPQHFADQLTRFLVQKVHSDLCDEYQERDGDRLPYLRECERDAVTDQRIAEMREAGAL